VHCTGWSFDEFFFGKTANLIGMPIVYICIYCMKNSIRLFITLVVKASHAYRGEGNVGNKTEKSFSNLAASQFFFFQI
jgi:hypothetical protein